MIRNSFCKLGLVCLFAMLALAPCSIGAQESDKSGKSTIVGDWNATPQTDSNGRPIGSGFPLLGNLVNDAGYESAYIGKWHVGTTLEQAGYSETVSPKRDRDKSQIASEFQMRDRDQPFF